MDALLRRTALATILGATAFAAPGCGLLGSEADRSVEKAFADPTLPAPKSRGQVPLDLPAKPAAGAVSAAKEPVAPQPASPAVVPASATAAVSAQPLSERFNATPVSQVKVVATVGADVIITDEEVSMMMKQRARDYLSLTGEDRQRKEREVYREELKKLIERELLLNDFISRVKKNKPAMVAELWERAGKITDDNFRQLKKTFGIKTEAEFAAELEKQGMSYKLFRRQMERDAMVSQFLGSVLREKNGTPTMAEVQGYYDRHRDEFQTKDRVKFLHLFVSASRFDTPAEAKARAEALRKAALNGGDFAAIVKEAGHGDSPLRDGAGVGETRGEIRPAELEETVFALKAGAISDVVATASGYHVVKVVSREVAGVRPFDDKLQTEIRIKLMNHSTKGERDKLVAALWRSTGVTIPDAALAAERPAAAPPPDAMKLVTPQVK